MEYQLLEDIPRVELFQIICNIQEDEADPEDTRRLMRMLCCCIDEERTPPRVLLRYVRDSFDAILKGKDPKRALGIVGRPGRVTKREFHIEVATEFLRLIIKGIKPETIKKQLDFKFNLGKSQLEGIWKKYKVEAVWQLRYERQENNPVRFENPFRPKEIAILKKLYPENHRFKKQLEEEQNHSRYRKNPSCSD